MSSGTEVGKAARLLLGVEGRGAGVHGRHRLILLQSSILIIRHQDGTGRTLTGVATRGDVGLSPRVSLTKIFTVIPTSQTSQRVRRRGGESVAAAGCLGVNARVGRPISG